MKLLTFQARRFAWKAFSQTLEGVPEGTVEGELSETVVVFVHAQSADEAEGERSKIFRRTLKHVKWLANKREFKNVVLHSFAHLGGDNATPEFTNGFLNELCERLESTGYTVGQTPFGWFCEWELSVYGESLAKVWKEV